MPGQHGRGAERVGHAGRAHRRHFHHFPLGRLELAAVQTALQLGGHLQRRPPLGPAVAVGGGGIPLVPAAGVRPVQQVHPERRVVAAAAARGRGRVPERRVKVEQAAVEQRLLVPRHGRRVVRPGRRRRSRHRRFDRQLVHQLAVGERAAVRQVQWPRGRRRGRQRGRLLRLGLVHRLVVPVVEVVHVMVLVVVVRLAGRQRRLVQRHQRQLARVRRVVYGQRLFQVLAAADGHASTLDLFADHLENFI